MSESDKELQSNTDEYEDAMKPGGEDEEEEDEEDK